MLWVGFAGVGVAAVLFVSRVESLPSLWLPFLVLFAAMWLVLPFRIELASGVGTVSIGVAVVVLAFIAEDVEPVSALVLWLISILLIQVILRRSWLIVVYWSGLTARSGAAFVLVRGLFPGFGWWPVLAVVPSVLAYAVLAIGSEYVQAVIAFSGMPGRICLRR
ncbi:hypothetical protein [Subtercola boreus]|uniref:hypothetical protein n=1 Tax=Subtercola boreus TaxID=120213 RepID=UPI001559DDA9|nr:hypothetical protein [Subtercola boreus]